MVLMAQASDNPKTIVFANPVTNRVYGAMPYSESVKPADGNVVAIGVDVEFETVVKWLSEGLCYYSGALYKSMRATVQYLTAIPNGQVELPIQFPDYAVTTLNVTIYGGGEPIELGTYEVSGEAYTLKFTAPSEPGYYEVKVISLFGYGRITVPLSVIEIKKQSEVNPPTLEMAPEDVTDLRQVAEELKNTILNISEEELSAEVKNEILKQIDSSKQALGEAEKNKLISYLKNKILGTLSKVFDDFKI